MGKWVLCHCNFCDCRHEVQSRWVCSRCFEGKHRDGEYKTLEEKYGTTTQTATSVSQWDTGE